MQIDTDKAGLAISVYGFTAQRCSVTVCIAIQQTQSNFYSKYPEREAPIWNLVNLFPPLIWGLVFASIILVLLMFKVSSFIYSKMGFGENIVSEEMVLIPFR